MTLAFFLLTVLSSGARASPAQSRVEETVGQRLAADLTWTQAQRDARFGHMDAVFPVHVVARGGAVRHLRKGRSLPGLASDITDYLERQHIAGLLVIQDGDIRLESYALGLKPHTRWTGFSMTKAVTDTLVGAAIRSGTIHGLDDEVTRCLPEMLGSAYDGVTVRQLLTMTSGVQWNENYTSTDADNYRLYTTPPPAGGDATVEYMRRLTRSAPPGSRWHYNTGETDLLGVLLRRATGYTLAGQLSSAIWQKAGMQQGATWIATARDAKGQEFGGSGLSATLRDWGRLGLWVMEGGKGSVATDWFQEATRTQVKAGDAGYGYGWWPQQDGSFAALGIFGQSLLVDPQRRLVVVILGDWPEATGAPHSAARAALWQQVRSAVDRESNR